MKISVVARTFQNSNGQLGFGGAEIVLLNLVQTLASHGHKISVFQISDQNEVAFLEENILIHKIRKSPFWKLKLVKLASSEDCDIVIFQELNFAKFRTKGIPNIGINHGVYWDYPADPKYIKFIPFIGNFPFPIAKKMLALWRFHNRSKTIRAIRRCSFVLVFDTGLLRFVQAFAPDLRSRFRVAPVFSSIATNLQLLERAESKIEKFGDSVIVFVPRNHSVSSGYFWLKDVLVELNKMQPEVDWKMVSVGQSVRQDYSLAFKNGSTSDVILKLMESRFVELGHLQPEEMRSMYLCSDIVLIPTFAYEGICLASVEAASFGLPVVATNVGGLNDSVINGLTGILVSPRPFDIAYALNELIGDQSKRLQMGKTAFQFSSKFGKREFESAIIDLIDSIELQ